MEKNVMDPLAKAYFEKFAVRVEILSEFRKRKAWSDVIREGQEALELFIKGLLRHMGADPTFSHDPGKELKHYTTKIPEKFAVLTPSLVSWSRRLRRERELAFYGAADFVPTEEYTEGDASEVIEFLEQVSKAMKSWLKLK